MNSADIKQMNYTEVKNTEVKNNERKIGSQNYKIFLMNLKYAKDMKKIAHPNAFISVSYYEQLSLSLNNFLNKKQAEIVIARYNENTVWCHNYSNLITIYNKGIDDIPPNILKTVKLNNVGRESHTYLYHIINNWDNLADVTFFGQGNLSSDHDPFPICIYLQPKLEEITINLYSKGTKLDRNNRLIHNRKYLENIQKGQMKPAELDFVSWWYENIRSPYVGKANIQWSHGAIFSVSRDIIKSNPLSYYKKLIRCIESHDDPEEGHYFERCWYYIFNCGRLIET